MPEPVQLVLQFSNSNTSEVFNLTIPDESEEGFHGTEILTNVDNSELLYSVFTVRVAMMVGGVVGDFTTDSLTLGKFHLTVFIHDHNHLAARYYCQSDTLWQMFASHAIITQLTYMSLFIITEGHTST